MHTVSPPPSLRYIFLFLPGIRKLARVRVSAVQAYFSHKRHPHTVQWSWDGGRELGWRNAEKKQNKERQMLKAARRQTTWQRLYSKRGEKAHNCAVVNTPAGHAELPVRAEGRPSLSQPTLGSLLPFCGHVWWAIWGPLLWFPKTFQQKERNARAWLNPVDDTHLLFSHFRSKVKC